MKQAASLYPLWWNPWGDASIVFDQRVSISIDNLSYDKDADKKILFLAEPLAILPTVSEGAMRNAYMFDKIYTFCQSILDKYPQAELFEWGSTWLDFKDLKINKSNSYGFAVYTNEQKIGNPITNRNKKWKPILRKKKLVFYQGGRHAPEAFKLA